MTEHGGPGAATTRRLGSIVVVDPDATLRGLLGSALEEEGRFHVPAACANATDAVAAVAELRPDLVLVDVRLSGLRGSAVVDALREASPTSRVVVMVGHPSLVSRSRLVDAGAWDVVWKGAPVPELAERLATVARSYDARVEPGWLAGAQGRGASPPSPPRTGEATSAAPGSAQSAPAGWVARAPRRAIHAGWATAALASGVIALATAWWLAGGRDSALAATHWLPLLVATVLVLGAVAFAASWTHIVRMTSRAAAVHLELQALHDQQQEFVAIASHELRTPVTVISGFAATLEDRWSDLDDEARRLMLGRIAATSTRLGGLVEDLMTTSLTHRGAVQMVPERMTATALVQAALSGSLLATVDVDVVVPEGLAVRVDPTYGPRMLANLLDNAHKYGAEPFEVRVWRARNQIEFSVRDHGSGVPAEFVSGLFRAFRQAEGHERRRQGGIGLGLHTVASLAERSGGSVRHVRPDDGGAEFVLSLPLWSDRGGPTA